jgi:glycosyltransferase involved in cell wall biosynthesis
MSISVVVISKNAEKTIAQVLKSAQFADEVILVDIKSTDDTVQIAQKYCSKIYPYPEDSKFVEPVRNFALSKANKDWILVLDSDEEIPSKLAEKLLEIDQKDLGDIYYLPRKNIFSGFWMKHTGWWPDYQLRFFKNGSVSWSSKIHSPPIIEEKYSPKFLDARENLAILHHNYENTKDYLSRFDRYTDIEAEQKTEENGSDFTISQSGLLRAFSDDFLRRYFSLDGHKDGVRGFYLSILQSVYQMTTQMKIFDKLENRLELEKNNQQALIKDLHHFQKELNYWVRDLEIKQANGLAKISLILKRKMGL